MINENERLRILAMIESGEISPDEGARLLAHLADSSQHQSSPTSPSMRILEQIEGGEIDLDEGIQRLLDGAGADGDSLPEDDQPHSDGPQPADQAAPPPEVERWKRFWTIPLAVGVFVTALSGWWMNATIASSGYNFWFFCAWLPLFLGIALIALAVSSRTSPWLHVRVNQQSAGRHQRILISFPIPIRLTAWGLKTFGHRIPNLDLDETSIDEIILALGKHAKGDSPFYVHVEDDEHGERVQVFIG